MAFVAFRPHNFSLLMKILQEQGDYRNTGLNFRDEDLDPKEWDRYSLVLFHKAEAIRRSNCIHPWIEYIAVKNNVPSKITIREEMF